MGIIVIENLGEKDIHFQDSTRTLLSHLQENYVDWMHACGGKGRCTTCKAIILSGQLNLHAMTDAERHYLRKGDLAENERLACQCKVEGDIRVKVPEESKLPHLTYTD